MILADPQLSSRGKRVYTRRPLHERFWEKVARAAATECWIWTGHVGANGYGQIVCPDGTRATAHRVAWALDSGREPQREEDVCHRCDNRRCVNPAHLFLGSRSDNMSDCATKGRLAQQRGDVVHGERHPAAKLREVDILEIDALRRAGLGLKVIAARFGVSKNLVGMVLRRTIWRHVPRTSEDA